MAISPPHPTFSLIYVSGGLWNDVTAITRVVCIPALFDRNRFCFTVEQIVAVLKQAEAGVPLAELDFRTDLLPLEEAIRRTGS